MKNNIVNHNSGFGLLEIIIAVSVMGAVVFALSAVSQLSVRSVREASERTGAAFLMEETFEALKVMRDESWEQNIASLDVDREYAPFFNGTSWEATSADIVISGIFRPRFVLREVFRDEFDNIASAGAFDPDTRRIEITVGWKEKGDDKMVEGVTYITNLFND